MFVTSLMVAAAVAVLVGIAVVSTGHGGELTPAVTHRSAPHLRSDRTLAPANLPPARKVPPGPTLGPADVERIRFSKGLRGYSPAQVEEVLGHVVRSLAERDAHIADLEHRLLTRQLGDSSDGDGAEGGEESW